MASPNNNNKYELVSGLKTKVVNTNVADSFQGLLKWLDVNILPLIALPALAVLAADDIRGHLSHVSASSSLVIGIAIAAILAVKSHK